MVGLGEQCAHVVEQLVGLANVGSASVQQQARAQSPTPSRASEREIAVTAGVLDILEYRLIVHRHGRVSVGDKEIHVLPRSEVITHLQVCIFESHVGGVLYPAMDQIIDVALAR